MSILQYKEKIASIGGFKIRARDAVFIIKPSRSVEWGKYIKYTSPRAVWYNYDALIVITNLKVMKLARVDSQQKHHQISYNEIIEQVRNRKIKSMLDLYSAIGKLSNKNGSPVKLVETKLEYFYD